MKHINLHQTSKKLRLLMAPALLACASQSHAEIKITEIMPSNISTIVSEQYDYNGYVEIYNDGGQVDLNGWTITNEKEGSPNWSIRLTQSHVLQQGYNLLFFGTDKETNGGMLPLSNVKSAGCITQKLTSDAGTLTLSNGNQRISIAYPKQYPHLSYGDGGFMTPTPGQENAPTYAISNRVETPKFSGTNPGVVNSSSASVTLTTNTADATIYYTLDGSIPTPTNGTAYSAPIAISQTTIVRARAYKDGALYSPVATGSYLFTNDLYSACGSSQLPIVSLSSDRDHFYGDRLGLCVKGTNGAPSACSSDMNGNANYNQDWTRPANFEYIVNGQVVDCQEVEVGIFGGCSRSHDVKSFKIKANKRTGANKFQYTNFFADRSYKKYKSLALRNGGNGWYLYPRWRDGFMQSLTKGMNIDYQAYQPVAYFLNGEYKGLMGLRERTDEDYIYQNYGLEEDEIEYLRVIKGEGYVAQIGTDKVYKEMEQYAQQHYSDADFFDKLSEIMDIDEYIDYQIIQQFIGNTDWVNNNTKLWRKIDGGKFRWILFDVDFGMSQHTNVNNNMLLFTTIGNAADNSNNNNGGGVTPGGNGGWGGIGGGGFDWGGGGFGGFDWGGGFGGGTSTVDQSYCTLFSSCMKNEDFKYKFLDRYTYLLETKFNYQRIVAVMDSIAQLTQTEVCAMFQRNGLGAGTQQQYESGIESMKTFSNQRPTIVERQLVNYYEVQSTKAKVNVRLNFGGATPEYSFMVNKIKSENSAYERQLFVGERIKIEVREPFGYKIQSWTINGSTQNGNATSYVGTVADNGMEIQVSFVKDNEFRLPQLFLNEFCASNGSTEDEYGSKPDWIEVYNNEDHEVDLAGMIVKNMTTGASSVIPYNYSTTIIPAKGRAMLWCDKEPTSGPLHLDFKLSASAEQRIQLVIPYEGREEKIDEVTYKLHDRDGSYGRNADGTSDLKIFPACGKESNGLAIASPDEANGSVKCSYVPNGCDEATADNIVYPNPTTTEWTLNSESEYTISNIAGDVIEIGQAHKGARIGSQLIPGVYLLHIEGDVIKIVKY